MITVLDSRVNNRVRVRVRVAYYLKKQSYTTIQSGKTNCNSNWC